MAHTFGKPRKVSHWHCMKVVGYADARELCNVEHAVYEDSVAHYEATEWMLAAPGRWHGRMSFGACPTDEDLGDG